MIKANELRIGNIISRRREEGRVVEVDTEYVWMMIGGEYGDAERWGLESVDPIELTPEMLEKCGFVYRHDYWQTDMVDIKQEEDGFRLCTEDPHEGDIYLLGNPFQYLHQLQNLYFALTGEELNCQL